MTFSTEFLIKARLELIEAWTWYEDKQPGLGDRFKQQVYNCIDKIEREPERYQESKKNYRQVSVKIFPYLIIYRIHKRKKVIAIVSIFHTRRHPKNKYRKT